MSVASSLQNGAPKVVIDARMVTAIPHGIARYVSQLALGLKKQKEKSGLNYEPIFLINSNSDKTPLATFQTVTIQSPFLDPREMLEIPTVLRNMGASLYHSPSFSSLWNCPCPYIVTIHDLNHLTYGSMSKKIYYKILLRRFASRASVLVTVSEFSRQEIATWLAIPPARIQVVYNALDFALSSPTPSEVPPSLLAKLGLVQGKYFFCLSNPKPHKNLTRLVSSYKAYRSQQTQPWPLVLNVDHFSSVPGVKSIGALHANETMAILSSAGGMLFPSLYEGFGLPPLEAAISRIPLAISKIPPHEEGLIDLEPEEVLWVNPTDLQGWTEAFQRVSQGEIQATSDASRSKILTRFSQEKMALHMDQIYRHVLGLTP